MLITYATPPRSCVCIYVILIRVFIYIQQAHAQTPVYSVRMRTGVKRPSLICFLTFFHLGKPVPVGQSSAALAAGGMRWL